MAWSEGPLPFRLGPITSWTFVEIKMSAALRVLTVRCGRTCVGSLDDKNGESQLSLIKLGKACGQLGALMR